MKHILTIDLEEYFQVANMESTVARSDWSKLPSRVGVGMGRLLEALATSGASATCFVLGVVAERNPELVRRIQDAGLEIASHGYDHRRVSTLTPEEFSDDLTRTEEAIDNACGARVQGYRAPHFSIGHDCTWALEILAERGYRFDSSVFPGYHPEYGWPASPTSPYRFSFASGASLVEVPVAVLRLGPLRIPVAGGGYLRWSPAPVFRALLRTRQLVSRAPFTLYCHPWELDPEQPRLAMTGLRRLRHHIGLEHTEAKLRRLLRDFEFGSVSEVLSEAPLPEVELSTPLLEGLGA